MLPGAGVSHCETGATARKGSLCRAAGAPCETWMLSRGCTVHWSRDGAPTVCQQITGEIPWNVTANHAMEPQRCRISTTQTFVPTITIISAAVAKSLVSSRSYIKDAKHTKTERPR